jgi:hypothetical protein
MSDGYNFAHLKAEILKLSKATDWETARKEWKLIGISQADEPEACLCGHFPIIDLCTITNAVTGQSVDVGNVCVKRFLGFRSDLIFASIKRIRNNPDKSIGPDAAALFHQQGIINDWEYRFQQDTHRKRDLTARQLASRHSINRKVLASIGRRGIA